MAVLVSGIFHFCNAGGSEIRVVEFIAVKGAVSDTVAEQVRTYFTERYAL